MLKIHLRVEGRTNHLSGFPVFVREEIAEAVIPQPEQQQNAIIHPGFAVLASSISVGVVEEEMDC